MLPAPLRSILRDLCEGALPGRGTVLHVLQGLGDEGRGVRVGPQDARQLVICVGRSQLPWWSNLVTLPGTGPLQTIRKPPKMCFQHQSETECIICVL